VLEALDHVIFAFFVLEMCVKMFAMGLIGKQAYLDDWWNILDLFIVIAG
jgi:Ion transport protein